jgi:hypothetical protein
MPSAKYVYPRLSHAGPEATSAAPIRKPIATWPRGPIQSLSIAYFRKYDMPMATAISPTRLSQRPAIMRSQSSGLSRRGAGTASPGTAVTGTGRTGAVSAAARAGSAGAVATSEDGTGTGRAASRGVAVSGRANRRAASSAARRRSSRPTRTHAPMATTTTAARAPNTASTPTTIAISSSRMEWDGTGYARWPHAKGVRRRRGTGQRFQAPGLRMPLSGSATVRR